MGELGKAHIGADFSGYPDGLPENPGPQTPEDFSILIDGFVESFSTVTTQLERNQLNDEFQELISKHADLYEQSMQMRREATMQQLRQSE